MPERGYTYQDFLIYWKTIVLIVAPLILLPIPICWLTVDLRISLCTYVVLIMAIYWCTETVEIATTALIPLFAFPLLGILTAKETANAYVTDLSFLFMGGLIVGVALEEVNLHRRFALTVLNFVGSEPKWLMAGVMFVAAFLSMWISNTATTSMMVPIVMALLVEVIRTDRLQGQEQEINNIIAYRNPSYETDPDGNVREVRVDPIDAASNITVNSETDPDENPLTTTKNIRISRETLNPGELKLVRGMLLALCHAASLGGTGTLTGTPPNLVMTNLLAQQFGEGHPVNFATWFAYNGPGLVINLFVTWFWLNLVWYDAKRMFSCKKVKQNVHMKRYLKKEIKALGPMRFEEVGVLILFCVLLILWLTRSYTWGRLFNRGGVKYVSDATSVMLIVFIMFAWPRAIPDFKKSYPALITFEAVRRKLAWDVLILLGGGFAIGQGVRKTGLSPMIGTQLAKLNLSKVQVCVLSLVIMTYTTEFTSNTATSDIFLPIVISLANRRCINPLYLTMPTSEAASFAFMLPVATPPNAIVFSTGILRVWDMVKTGFFLNVFCMCEVLLSIHAWGHQLFKLWEFPEWAHNNDTNHCFPNITNNFYTAVISNVTGTSIPAP